MSLNDIPDTGTDSTEVNVVSPDSNAAVNTYTRRPAQSGATVWFANSKRLLPSEVVKNSRKRTKSTDEETNEATASADDDAPQEEEDDGYVYFDTKCRALGWFVAK